MNPSMYPHKLGKRAPRLDRRTLRLKKYLAIPSPPTAVDWQGKVSSWPMLLNDVLGCCVEAAAAHDIQDWTTYCGDPTVPTNNCVVDAYEQTGGYIPGVPNSDNGTDMLTFLNWWRSTGMLVSDDPAIPRHKIQAFMSVSPTSFPHIKSSIELFGSVFLGIQLPISAQGQPVWQVPKTGPFGDGSPGSWGGHCVPIVAYSPTGLMVVSWGSIYRMTWNFLASYADEAYAILSPDWFEKSGKSPGNFALSPLLSDLAQL